MLRCINLKHRLGAYKLPLKLETSHVLFTSGFPANLVNFHAFHTLPVKRDHQDEIFAVADHLSACITSGKISEALTIFTNHFKFNTHLLNCIFRKLSDGGSFEKILDLNILLRVSDAKADNFTYPFVLRACAALFDSHEARLAHTQVLKCGFDQHVTVANSFIDMYSKLGLLEYARRMFDGMPERNLVSWNCMVSGYAVNGFPDAALELYSLIQVQGLRVDQVTLKIILPACGLLGACLLGESVHGQSISLGFSLDGAVQTAIMDMYAKCGTMNAAFKIFEEIQLKDAVVWNAMIGGYLQKGQLDVVFKLSSKMQAENVKYTVVSFLNLLQTCANAASLQTGEATHCYIIKVGFSSDASVEALLIKLYSSCGKLGCAFHVFRMITCENVNSWTAIICGLGMHGYGKAALLSFFKMLQRGIIPDSVCFLIMLSSCSHNGMVFEGFRIFKYMERHFGMKPSMEHYAAVVDIIGRAGFTDEACQFIERMPSKPDISAWGALLGACKIHGDFKMRQSEERLGSLNPRTAGYFKLLLSICASKEDWKEALKVRGLMSRGVKGFEGHSVVENFT